MKKTLLFISVFVITFITFGQAPNIMNYQAVLRNSSGAIMANESVPIRVFVNQGTPDGTIVFFELHTLLTNDYGLGTLQIGSLDMGNDLATIDWASDKFFLALELFDGSVWVDMGATQLMSVPYALYAETAGTPGTPGPEGPQGIQGEVGPKGDSGDTGAQGEQGLTGDQGLEGMEGPEGMPGMDGDEGPQGIEGEQGLTGDQGPKGDSGDTGAQGPDGTQGIQGEQGLTGPAGDPATDDQDLADVLGLDNDAGGLNIVNLADPVDAKDAATKAYVDLLENQILELQIATGLKAKDYDGNIYNTVVIGTQTWLTENIKTTHYSDGTAIPIIDDDATWLALDDIDTDKAYCWFGDDINNKEDHGALYTFGAAMNGDNSGSNVQGVCPTGWHVPSDVEWTVLMDYYGGVDYAGPYIAGNASIWYNGTLDSDPNFGESGLDIIPGGSRSEQFGSCSNQTTFGYLWSSTEPGTDTWAWTYRIGYSMVDVSRNTHKKSSGLSIRCLKD